MLCASAQDLSHVGFAYVEVKSDVTDYLDE